MFRMLTLYYRPTCPFCRRVLAVIDRLELQVELKDVNEEAIYEELLSIFEKGTVPYLIDTEKSVSMPESDDIVVHLQKNYGKQEVAPTRPRVHIADSVCLSCEG